MQVLSYCLLAVLLVGCMGEDPRYRDTRALERPPILAVDKSAEPILEDDSVIPLKKHKKGLKDDVSMKYSKPVRIIIKQPFENAWYSVGLGLRQSDIKITDSVRDKGQYFVSYSPGTLLGLFSKEQKQVIYLLALEASGQETVVTAKKANAVEQDSSLPHDGFNDEADDDAEDLLNNLFDTLKDDLVEE